MGRGSASMFLLIFAVAVTSIALDLLLESPRAPVIHGNNGVSQKAEGSGRASHYYSLTRMETKGSIEVDGRKHLLTGATWFDHEWATNQLAANQTGWDWFSLQLEDGSDLMLFQIRTKEGGRDPYSSATFSASSSRLITYGLTSLNVCFIQVDLPTDGGPTNT